MGVRGPSDSVGGLRHLDVFVSHRPCRLHLFILVENSRLKNEFARRAIHGAKGPLRTLRGLIHPPVPCLRLPPYFLPNSVHAIDALAWVLDGLLSYRP